MQSYDEMRFQRRVEQAMKEARTVLETNRNALDCSEVGHGYEDKFLVVERATNAGLAGMVNGLAWVGLTQAEVEKARAWSDKRAVTLRFMGEERCTFVRKATRTIEPSRTRETEVRTGGGLLARFSSKTVEKVTEWFWRFEATYEVVLQRGTGKESVVVATRTDECELVTRAEESPRPEKRVVSPIDVQITWLLQQLSESLEWEFAVARGSETCHTPRRNAEVAAALRQGRELATWCNSVVGYFKGHLFGVADEEAKKRDVSALTVEGIFSPVVPLMEDLEARQESGEKVDDAEVRDRPAKDSLVEGEELEEAASSMNIGMTRLPSDRPNGKQSSVFGQSDTNIFLAEQVRSLEAKAAELGKLFGEKGLVSVAEAKLVVGLGHVMDICQQVADAVQYMEELVREQVVAAIGKVVGAAEFEEYMRFHNGKLFQAEYAPRPFSYAVRQEGHSPEGVLTIEAAGAGADAAAETIRTVVRQSEAAGAMRVPINASTEIELRGERYVHAWMGHRFANESVDQLRLSARARQFSSFIVMVGRIAAADVFEPVSAVIVQNKDEVLVPLLAEEIPTAKEFRDAIESLSPEQQSFARAFRAMQLESTLFAVAVVEIKPQLEVVLNLPRDSLTKEIELSEDLLELFIKYQIPSDLMSYDGDEDASVKLKVANVQSHVASLWRMITKKSTAQLEEKKRESLFASPPPPPAPVALNDYACEGQLNSFSFGGGGMGGGGGGGLGGRSGACFGGAAPSGFSMQACAPVSLSSVVSAPPPVAAGGMVPASFPPASPIAPPSVTLQNVIQEPAKVERAEVASKRNLELDSSIDDNVIGEDYTKMPAKLDAKLLLLDEDSAVRPTIIKPSEQWTRNRQQSLLAVMKEDTLGADEQKTEKNKAFDLLDGLTKSGGLAVECCKLRVVIGVTHCFVDTVMNTLVQGNLNPIDKVERSMLIVAATVHDKPADELVKESRLAACKVVNPKLFSS